MSIPNIYVKKLMTITICVKFENYYYEIDSKSSIDFNYSQKSIAWNCSTSNIHGKKIIGKSLKSK